MNRTYNIVWSATRNMFIVASEFAHSGRGIRSAIQVTGAAVILFTGSVTATELGPQSGASVILEDGDTVTVSGGNHTTGIDSTLSGGSGLQINGKAIISVSGEAYSTGILLDNASVNNLGENTEIYITDTDATEISGEGTTAIQIYGHNAGTEVKASGLVIDVSGKKNVYGINNTGRNSVIDLGTGSSIAVETETRYPTGGIGDARGVYLADGSGSFTMDNGAISAISKDNRAWGIHSSGDAQIFLGSNSRIAAEGGYQATAIEVGKGGALYGDQLTLITSGLSDRSYALGMKLDSQSYANLGSGSTIIVNGSGSLAEGVDIDGAGATFVADDMDIDISASASLDCTAGSCTVRGISVDDKGAKVDLGSGSTISIAGFYDGAGISMGALSSGSELSADNLTIDVTGEVVHAVQMDGGFVDLGQHSTLSATGSSYTVWITGGKFQAESLSVSTSQSVGIMAQGGDVSIGAGSVVDGKSSVIPGAKTNGIAATAGSSLDFIGDVDNRNTIYAINGYGVSSQFDGATANIANTDIIMGGDNTSYGLWAIGSNDLTKPGIINGDNVTVDVTENGENGYGAVVQQGGSIALTGDTTIKTQGGIAILVDNSGGHTPGGTVTGTGVMNITGDVVNEGNGSIALDMASGSQFTGATMINTDSSTDTLLDLSLADQTQWIMTGDSSLTYLNNAGNIVFNAAQQTGDYSTLTIYGNYNGDGGNLYLNTQLGDDYSPTDKLVISGDTSGSTTVYVNNIGGEGALTTKGIEVIDVGGQSDGVFTQGNQVQSGLYEYRLYEDDGDWYLRSQAFTPVEPDDGGDITPIDPDDGGDITPIDPDDGGDVTPVDPQYRPDIGAYLGNQWMARNLQMQTLYDREGSQLHTDDGSMWMRFKAGDATSKAANGKVDIDSNYSQVQIGGDVLNWGDGVQSLNAGLMVSYINADTDSTGNRGADGSQFSANGNVDGYNVGGYATWFTDAKNHQGLYVDSWYQYGIYNNSVDNGDVGSGQYDSTASAASLETGYRYDIVLENQNIVSLTPQAQVTWQQYKADAVEQNGTRIDGQNGDSWTSRLGLRVDGKLRKNTTSVIQPFAEINWLHTRDDVAVSFDGSEVKQDLPADRVEAKVGIQANLNNQWSITGQIAGQKGHNDYGDLNGSLNVQYIW